MFPINFVLDLAENNERCRRPARRFTGAQENEHIMSRHGSTVDRLSSSYTPGSSPLTVSLVQPVSASGRTRLAVEKKLCEFCVDTIITSDNKWGMHHSNIESLQRSAAQGCTFCRQLCRDVRRQDTKITEILTGPHHRSWPLHRWTIRSPERLGDSDDTYAIVVFRQSMSLPASVDAYLDPVTVPVRLPERMFYLFQQSDPARMQSLRPLGSHTFSDESQQTIRDWIEICDKNHPKCAGRADRGFMPTRLLDLNYREGFVRVVDTRHSLIQEPYTTLSYCWGMERFVVLTPDNILQFMESGIDIKSLPKTIREAIQTTRMLGVRYIWIDSLCIIQGLAGDFQFEASLMLQVYRNSTVNLAASDSRSADGGIFRYRLEEELFDAECQGRPNSKIFGNSIWRIVPKAFWDSQVLQAQLNNRGWVFQGLVNEACKGSIEVHRFRPMELAAMKSTNQDIIERLLSPRILHFSSRQIFWDCATVSACETFREGLPKPLDTGSNDRYWRWKLQDTSDLNHFLPTIIDQSLEQFWRSAIRTYSRCQLTNNRDKLIAIWGIVKFLIGTLRERYAVGLWERNLEEQLAWYVVDCKTSRRQTSLGAPTWSWASINGEVILPDRFAAVRDYRVLNHDGQEIAFDLYGPGYSKNTGPRTWSEQLQQYEARLQEIAEYRQRLTEFSPHTEHQEDLYLDPEPRLRSPSIPIMTRIGRMHLQKEVLSSQWTRTVDHGLFEAFPDLDLGEGFESLFIILALSMASPDDSHGDTLAGFTDRCSGVGLLIDSGDSPAHFVRTGAFRFSDVAFSGLRNDFIDPRFIEDPDLPDDYDPEKGFKIWLD